MKQIKELTRAEERIMEVLWQLEKAFVKEVIAELPLPKPAYNTVSTFIRILETKGFIAHHSFGKSHQYFPLILKDEYKTFLADKLLNDYFDNSIVGMFSFFIEKENMDSNKELNVETD